jgi:hypothetical protein
MNLFFTVFLEAFVGALVTLISEIVQTVFGLR